MYYCHERFSFVVLFQTVAEDMFFGQWDQSTV